MTPFSLDLTYEIVTPLFMGTADQAQAALRAPSVRGAVRAWYRALDPDFRAREGRWFGAADEEDGRSAQSPWLLRVMGVDAQGGFVLDRQEYRDFDRGRPPEKTNGVLYTGFSLLDRFNRRTALHPSFGARRSTFQLRLVVPRPERLGADGLSAVLGSFWLLGHLGGLGSRAMRGWGGVQLLKIEEGPGRLPEAFKSVVEALKPAPATDPAAWAAGAKRTLFWLKGQMGGERAGAALATPHLGARARVLVLKRGHRDWAGAIDDAGASLQAFRRKERGDREAVLDELLSAQHPSKGDARLRVAPRRVAFGLPLTFRFGIVPQRAKLAGAIGLRPDTIEFGPKTSDDSPRHPGLARLRVLHLGQSWHAVVVRLDGEPPGKEEGVVGKLIDGKVPAGDTGLLPLPKPPEGAVDDWIKGLVPLAIEVAR